MVKLPVIVCIVWVTLVASAQVAPPPEFPAGRLRTLPGAAMHESLTRQFEIREADDNGISVTPPRSGGVAHYVQLDPTLLTVSCERIKHALLEDLDSGDNWRGRIYIELQHARTLNDTVIIGSSLYGNSWTYHVRMPDTVEYTRFVTSIVDVLLLERANRNADHSAEIPVWLGYGLTQDILRLTHIELVLEPVKPNPQAQGLKIREWTSAGTNTNALAIAHMDLQAAPPLTLDQLSWPDEARLEGPEGETYRSSAQLFVRDLLGLRGGRPAMCSFIEKLPQHLNWQLSFLDAFHEDFGNQLDLEKWWALRLADFTGRDISQTWSHEESWGKLDEIIHPVVEVRAQANELPLRTRMSLQTIIEKWDMVQQTGLLREKSKQLFSLRSRVSQQLAKLVDDYRRTIDVYLAKRNRQGNIRTGHVQAVLGLDPLAEQTIADLDVLDSIREDLRPKSTSIQSVEASSRVNR